MKPVARKDVYEAIDNGKSETILGVVRRECEAFRVVVHAAPP